MKLNYFDQEPVAWRWRVRDSIIWTYDPTPDWLERWRDHEGIETEPLYAAPAAPAQPQVPDGWQPIATAPKDGKPTVVWDASPNGGLAVAHLSSYPRRSDTWVNPGGHKLQPTHWMRPAPPLAQSEPVMPPPLTTTEKD